MSSSVASAHRVGDQAVVERFASCHGFAIDPAEIGQRLGWLEQRPPWRVHVDVVASVERAVDAKLVWRLDEPPAHGLPLITTQTWEEPGGTTWIGNTLNLALRLDYERERVIVAPKDGNEQVLLEALASVALPVVAQHKGAVVLHASAAARDGKAVLFCAPGGSGKSSLLMGLVAAGWKAVSEDQCVIDVGDGGQHRIWPGPSWVRAKHGAPRPALVGDEPRFEAVDKLAWDLGTWMARSAAELQRIVLLEAPGGTDVLCEPVSPEYAIPKLAQQSTWLQSQDAFAAAVLPQIVNLGMTVPAVRLRVPRRPDWLALAVSAVLDA